MKYLYVAIILLAALLVRGTMLTHPDQVVFDEVHFGKFITAYCCTGQNFFDIHPPHGKLLIAAVAKIAGYSEPFPFITIGESYGEDVPVAALRLLPMLSGALLPVIIFLLLRQLGATWPIAFLGGFATALDNALVVQSRLIALDMILLVATFGSLSLWLTAEHRFTKEWAWWLFALAGVAAGLAAGTKFTGLAALGVLGILTVVKLWQVKDVPRLLRRWIMAGLVVLAAAVATYCVGWAVHWAALPLPGTGDAFYQAGSVAGLRGVITDTVNLHRVMLSANYNLTATHPYASLWWQWPLLARPVFYWQGIDAFIYLLGNPVVWWGSALLFVVAISHMVIRFGQGRSLVIRQSISDNRGAGKSAVSGKSSVVSSQLSVVRIWIPLLAFVVTMFPFIRIPRALFLYHYFTPLLFSLLVGLLWLDSVVSSRQRRIVVFAGTAAILTLFFWFAPLTYGLSIREQAHSTLFWFATWR